MSPPSPSDITVYVKEREVKGRVWADNTQVYYYEYEKMDSNSRNSEQIFNTGEQSDVLTHTSRVQVYLLFLRVEMDPSGQIFGPASIAPGAIAEARLWLVDPDAVCLVHVTL